MKFERYMDETGVEHALSMLCSYIDEAGTPKWRACIDDGLYDLANDSSMSHDIGAACEQMETASDTVHDLIYSAYDECDEMDADCEVTDERLAAVRAALVDAKGKVGVEREAADKALDAAEVAVSTLVEALLKNIKEMREGVRAEFDHYDDGIEFALEQLDELRALVEEVDSR